MGICKGINKIRKIACRGFLWQAIFIYDLNFTTTSDKINKKIFLLS